MSARRRAGVHRIRAGPRPGRSCAGKFAVACGMRPPPRQLFVLSEYISTAALELLTRR
jgi:hypothetical protein